MSERRSQMSVTKRFPDRPNLRHLKEQAFHLREAFQRGDPEARSRAFAVSALARLAHDGIGELTVTQSQFVIAREYGFRSWPELKRAVEEKLRAQETRRGPIMDGKRNITIDEVGTIGEGAYGSIVINGTGTADGDIEADEITVNGVGNFGGSVKARQFAANGACRVGDSLETEKLEVGGDLSVGDHLTGKEILVNGGCRVGDGVKAGALTVNGGFSVGDGVVCETLSANGGVKVGDAIEARSIEATGGLKAESLRVTGKLAVKHGGLDVDEEITAGEADLELESDSRAEVIKAGRIRVRATGGRFGGMGRRIVEEVHVALNAGLADRMAGMVKNIFKARDEVRDTAKTSEVAALREAAAKMAQEAEKLAARADELEAKVSAAEEEEEARIERVVEEAERKIEEAERKIEEAEKEIEEAKNQRKRSSEGGE